MVATSAGLEEEERGASGWGTCPAVMEGIIGRRTPLRGLWWDAVGQRQSVDWQAPVGVGPVVGRAAAAPAGVVVRRLAVPVAVDRAVMVVAQVAAVTGVVVAVIAMAAPVVDRAAVVGVVRVVAVAPAR